MSSVRNAAFLRPFICHRAPSIRNPFISILVTLVWHSGPASATFFHNVMVQKLEVHGDELDGRAREVLREIVIQHISSGEAISSRSLAKCEHFQLSPTS